MAKLGQYSYPDIRFGDAVEIAGRILTKYKGVASVKGLAWELGMAEGSGTLFAKVAALRDFGLVEGRGELRVSALAQQVLHPTTPEEGHTARAEAFQRVELLRQLYTRFEGDIPDDMSMLVGLEEITRAPRQEIVRRAPLIQKHLQDAIRVLGRTVKTERTAEHSAPQQIVPPVYAETLPPNPLAGAEDSPATAPAAPPLPVDDGVLQVLAAGRTLSVPLTPEYIDVAITLLKTLRVELCEAPATSPDEDNLDSDDETELSEVRRPASELELGPSDQLEL